MMLILCTIKSDHVKFLFGTSSYFISAVENNLLDSGPVKPNHFKRQYEVANFTLPHFFTLGNGDQ